MARYKVMGMNKGSMSVIASFNSRKEAEAYVRLAQRSSKYGSIKIDEEKGPPAGGPGGAGGGSGNPIPAQDAATYANQPKAGKVGMPYVYIIAIAVAILVGAGLLIDFLNRQLSQL